MMKFRRNLIVGGFNVKRRDEHPLYLRLKVIRELRLVFVPPYYFPTEHCFQPVNQVPSLMKALKKLVENGLKGFF